MAGLVPAIHAFDLRQDVDARHKAGHDDRVSLPAAAKRKGVPSPIVTPSTVIPAQAGIQKR